MYFCEDFQPKLKKTMTNYRLIPFVLCLLFHLGAAAQTTKLSDKMAAYRDFCLLVNQGFREASNDVLMQSIQDCTDEEFIFKGEDLLIQPNDQLSDVDAPSSEGKSYIHYQPEYVDSVLMLDLVSDPSKYNFLDQAHTERGDFYDCTYAYRALPAHGKGTYAITTSGQTEVMIVAMLKGKVRMTLHDEANNMTTEQGGSEGQECVWHNWNMQNSGRVTITVENTTDQPLAFMIATN